jgi:putative Mg2+ transporter-C (MgtC) family protein
MTLAENVALPLETFTRLSPPEIREIVALKLALVGLAGFLGACLGIERELARKPAGLRTHILVAVSAAALMLIGDGVAERFDEEQAAVRVAADPLRVMEAVVVGISFLGAGTIVHARGAAVEGLTTAASVLLTAAVGMAVALGRVPLATMVTLGAVAVIYLLGLLERRLGTNRAPDALPVAERKPARLQQMPPGSS